MPVSNDSGTPGSARCCAGHERTTKIMPTKNTALARKALPDPTQSVNAPAMAGPIARETFIATAPSATALGTSAVRPAR